MKNRTTLSPLTDAQREAIEARFAMRLSARLDEGAQALPHDISERLRVAREQAVRVALAGRLSAAVEVAHVSTPVVQAELTLAGAGGALTGQTAGIPAWREAAQARTPSHGRKLDDGPLGWGWRLATVVPVLALLAGLWGVNHYQKQEQVEATTDVDMALLTDELPPDAYSDPGFEAYLKDDTGPTVRAVEDMPPEADGDLKTTETAPASSTP